MVNRATEWTVIFWSNDDGSSRDPDFPEHAKWQPDKQASMEEGERVLRELKSRGDQREWCAFGFPSRVLRSAGSPPEPQDWWYIPPIAD